MKLGVLAFLLTLGSASALAQTVILHPDPSTGADVLINEKDDKIDPHSRPRGKVIELRERPAFKPEPSPLDKPFYPGAAMPDMQVYFIDVLEWFRVKVDSAKNELQVAQLLDERKKDLTKIAQMPVDRWVGEVTHLKAKLNGDAQFAVRISSTRELGNSTIPFADSIYKSDIPKGSALYEAISRLEIGQGVFVSGKFGFTEQAGIKEEAIGKYQPRYQELTSSKFVFVFEKVSPISMGNKPVLPTK